MSATAVITDVSQIVTAVGVVFLGGNFLLARNQGKTDFEDHLTGEYRQMIKPELAPALLASLSREDRKKVEPYYRYIDFCNEQVFLRTQGRIRRSTWDEWSPGIQERLGQDPLRGAWAIASKELQPDFENLRRFAREGFRDPRKWQPWWRRIW